MKNSGRECIIAYGEKNYSSYCFNIYNTPKFDFIEKYPLKLEINHTKKLNLISYGYPKNNIKFYSNHPEIINVNHEGNIIALRPGNAIIYAKGLDSIKSQIKVLAILNKGFINHYTLDMYNANKYENLMIVAHPDDETLWGGANLFNDSYFVICLTNGYNIARSTDFKEILKFTNNSGIILNYPDVQDNIRDNWSNVKFGIIKDLSIIINFKNWSKIVTHEPEGITGHIHHKITSQYTTEISKKYNKFSNLYYFGKLYDINSIPKYLQRINDRDLEIKKKEVEIYKSVKRTIYKLWYHMLPYENWILASNWKNG